MRCPYCGNLNADKAVFCTSCGRDLQTGQPRSRTQAQQAHQSSYAPPRQVPQHPSQPYQPNVARPVPPPPVQPPPQQQAAIQRSGRSRTPATVSSPPPPVIQPVTPPAPEPPAPFPPRTMEQLQALEVGALAYSVVDSTVSVGNKKIVRISYPRAANWQQVATLFRALKEQMEERFDTIIIQGVQSSDSSVYAFTNGQLTCDRRVLLGSQKLIRYILETGNGFDSDSVRIVLTEPQSK